ncbi:cupin domain-containing protein [Nostoc sp. 'Peltigera membranacea cyanobiont' 232]|uniref:cupin domain-containing protein n=1 Tax=Nostoc sp. 'Peltigera membranacea cyanobiont' 232 TaxID=2014531 RepID=UPI000B95A22A|nr:cupin domain-containing protein [Nostoc sp. 'Peltigera membranacea cyanobiont' 232]OYD99212.1 hypothetical protein CDG79_39760 [Nostoc sp. 'Peltigera membranacea cyanobiont' 232]
MSDSPFTLTVSKGRNHIAAPSDRVTYFISNSELDFVENEVGYLAGPPLHLHPYQTEIHYLIQGKLRYHIGEEILELTSGDSLCIPKNTPHAWINLYSEPARIVAILTPGGSEGFFQSTASVALEPAALIKLAQDYGVEILGAPLAVSMANSDP